jgi:hypothetical protein
MEIPIMRKHVIMRSLLRSQSPHIYIRVFFVECLKLQEVGEAGYTSRKHCFHSTDGWAGIQGD